MQLSRPLTLLLPLLFALSAVAADAPKTMRLATLEWLPYTGTIVPQDGMSSVTTTSAASKAGYNTKIEYFDWTVAVEKGMKDPSFAGYFPEYYTDDLAQNRCYMSAPIGKSTLGLATLKENQVQWKTLSDLNKMTIGVVDGYSNGEAFDNMVKQGKQPVENAPSDTSNLRKLIGKKVRVIAIDREVLRYLLSTSPKRGDVVFNDHPLAELTLHVCFKRTPAGHEMQQAFDAGLQKVDIHKIEADYMKQIDAKGK